MFLDQKSCCGLRCDYSKIGGGDDPLTGSRAAFSYRGHIAKTTALVGGKHESNSEPLPRVDGSLIDEMS